MKSCESFLRKGSAKSRIYVNKSRNMRFSQKGLTTFQKLFSIWIPMNPLSDWKAKLESVYSLMVQNCKNTEWKFLNSENALFTIFWLNWLCRFTLQIQNGSQFFFQFYWIEIIHFEWITLKHFSSKLCRLLSGQNLMQVV